MINKTKKAHEDQADIFWWLRDMLGSWSPEWWTRLREEEEPEQGGTVKGPPA